jgi:hypothetical protein
MAFYNFAKMHSSQRREGTMNTIYDKTDKGREEITTRQHRLAPRLRTLLVLVDGKHGAEELLKTVSGLGLMQENFNELLEQGFIFTAGARPTSDSAPAEPEPVAALEPETTVATADDPSSGPAAAIPGTAITDATRFQNVYQFYNETIKTTIGLRGYGLQLKVERAGTLDELRALRRPYLEAVLKAKGNEVARSLRDRLDLLFGPERSEAAGNTVFNIGAE